MSKSLFYSVLPVSLAGGASTTIPHGLNSHDKKLTPNVVLPDRGTPIVVTVVDNVDVTFHNPSASAAAAFFFAEILYSTQRDPSDPGDIYWQGASSGLPPPPAGMGTFDVVIHNGVPTTRQHEVIEVSFDGSSATEPVVWPDFQARPFTVDVGDPVTDDPSIISVNAIEATVTPTGCQLQATVPFIGKVTVEVLEVLP